jgi:hypothetical protein
MMSDLAKDPDATARVAATIEQASSPPLMSRLLDAIAQMAGRERHSLLFLSLATNPNLVSTVRGKAVDLVKDQAHLPVVRDAFASALVLTDPKARFTRMAFIERVPECYPSDQVFSRTLVEIAQREQDEPFVRSAAVKALMTYPTQGICPPGLVTSYLSSMEAADNWGEFTNVAEKAAALGCIEVVPLFNELLTRYEGAGNAPLRVTALRNWLAKLKHR